MARRLSQCSNVDDLRDLARRRLQPVIGRGQVGPQNVGPACRRANAAPAIGKGDPAQLGKPGDVKKGPAKGRGLMQGVDIGAAGHHQRTLGGKPVKCVF